MGGTGSKRDSIKDATEEFTIPSGLYRSFNWDTKTIKRLILTKRLAPLFPGQEECVDTELEECPICFLFYPGLNRSTCCKKGICTECFLQIKKPNGQASCPFCQRGNYSTVYTGPLTKEEREKEAWEQQQVIEAKIRMRNEEIEQDKLRERQKLELLSSSRSNSIAETILTSQSLPNPQILNSNQSLSLSTSYPPTNNLKNISKDFSNKKRDGDLEDLMLQEALRLSLLNFEDSSVNFQTKDTPEDSDLETESPSSNKDELELALALALSLQNVIK